MKKLLMVAVLSLFVANAYALETKIYGEYQLAGNWFINDNLGDDTAAHPSGDTTFFGQFLRIFAEISPEPGTKIVLRATPFDIPERKFGGAPNDAGKTGGLSLDRAWIQYAINDSLTVLGGRVNFNNFSASGWAQGWYDTGFKESGGGDGFGAIYKLNDQVTLTALVGKADAGEAAAGGRRPGVAGANTNGQDNDAYVLMADLKFGDIAVNPRLTYVHGAAAGTKGPEGSAKIYGVYLDGQYKPATGINAIVAVAYVGGDTGQVAPVDSISMYGAYADVSYKADMFKAGLRLAYSSSDAEDGDFGFGGDFDKTSYIDQTLFNETGVRGMTFAQIYGEIYLMGGDLTIMPSFAYYFSNVDNDRAPLTSLVNNTGAPLTFVVGEDTNAFELDLIARYKFTNFTTLTAGYALAQVNDIGLTATTSYDADMAHKLFWNVSTKF